MPSPGGAKRVLDAIESSRLPTASTRRCASQSLGHKADLGIMALGPDLARLQRFQHELLDVPLVPDVVLRVAHRALGVRRHRRRRARAPRDEEGITDPAEIDARLAAWRERMAHYRENRLHPRLPRKRRSASTRCRSGGDADANWYELDFDARKQLMAGHARVGRRYAGRVLQLITGSTGLDDWEWGVTLLADDPVALKEIVYEMRFDPVLGTLRGVRSLRHRPRARSCRGPRPRRPLTQAGDRPVRTAVGGDRRAGRAGPPRLGGARGEAHRRCLGPPRRGPVRHDLGPPPDRPRGRRPSGWESSFGRVGARPGPAASTPLQIVRAAYGEPTAVPTTAGIPPVSGTHSTSGAGPTTTTASSPSTWPTSATRISGRCCSRGAWSRPRCCGPGPRRGPRRPARSERAGGKPVSRRDATRRGWSATDRVNWTKVDRSRALVVGRRAPTRHSSGVATHRAAGTSGKTGSMTEPIPRRPPRTPRDRPRSVGAPRRPGAARSIAGQRGPIAGPGVHPRDGRQGHAPRGDLDRDLPGRGGPRPRRVRRRGQRAAARPRGAALHGRRRGRRQTGRCRSRRSPTAGRSGPSRSTSTTRVADRRRRGGRRAGRPARRDGDRARQFEDLLAYRANARSAHRAAEPRALRRVPRARAGARRAGRRARGAVHRPRPLQARQRQPRSRRRRRAAARARHGASRGRAAERRRRASAATSSPCCATASIRHRADAGDRVAERLLEACRSDRSTANGEDRFLSASIGIALVPDGRRARRGAAPRRRRRDVPGEATRQGAGRCFDERMRSRRAARLSRPGRDLRARSSATSSGCFYQPIVDLATDTAASARGAAALAAPRARPGRARPLHRARRGDRAHRPDRASGRSREACRQVAAWQAIGLLSIELHVAVNLSARQFRRPIVRSSSPARCVSEAGSTARSLCLEITESVLMEEPTQVGASDVAEVARRAVLAHRRLRHRLLVARLPQAVPGRLGEGRPVVRRRARCRRRGLRRSSPRSSSLGHALGLSVVAEGVETQLPARRACARSAATAAQGFLVLRRHRHADRGSPAVLHRPSPRRPCSAPHGPGAPRLSCRSCVDHRAIARSGADWPIERCSPRDSRHLRRREADGEDQCRRHRVGDGRRRRS